VGDSSRSRPLRERPSDEVSDNRHRQRWTPADTHGRPVAGQLSCDAGSPRLYLASGRRGQPELSQFSACQSACGCGRGRVDVIGQGSAAWSPAERPVLARTNRGDCGATASANRTMLAWGPL